MARETLKLSLKGVEMVKDAKQAAKRAGKPQKTLDGWRKSAYVALPTLKRFIKGEAILKENFIALCEAIGIDWAEAIDSQCPNSQEVSGSVVMSISPSAALSNTFCTPPELFMLVGTFTHETEAKVKVALRLLVQILQKADIKPDVTFDGEQRIVSIIGSLPTQERAKAEAVLNHLKKLLDDCEMTFLNETESFKEVA